MRCFRPRQNARRSAFTKSTRTPDTGSSIARSIQRPARTIIKCYEVGKGAYIEIDPEEFEAIAVDSKRTIEIDEFVPKEEIDELYLNTPYYIGPDGEVGRQAFARETIKQAGMVAIGKVVFTSREHVISLEPRGKGLLRMTIAKR